MPTAPKSAFPTPAATLPGEADILANVLTDLSDHDAKLVYADWLEENGDKRGPLLREFVTAFRTGKKQLPTMKSAPQPWRDLIGITLVQKLQKTALAPKTSQLLALARPSISYKTSKAAEKTLPVGASKFGGCPDLLPETSWPQFEDRALSFLGQFNLADLRPSPVARELPATGMLSAFCLYEAEGGNDDFSDGNWRLLYFPDASKLVRVDLPDELADESRFPSCRVEYAEALTLPDRSSPWEKELKPITDLDPSDFTDLYYDMCPGDHILGYPFPIQGDFLGKKSVRHLLTICGNDETGWEWGDGSALYFTLSETDLKKGKFDRVNMIMDCG